MELISEQLGTGQQCSRRRTGQSQLGPQRARRRAASKPRLCGPVLEQRRFISLRFPASHDHSMGDDLRPF